MAKSRLIGSYPVIGIRPTIDGRRGALDVRGSLEDQYCAITVSDRSRDQVLAYIEGQKEKEKKKA